MQLWQLHFLDCRSIPDPGGGKMTFAVKSADAEETPILTTKPLRACFHLTSGLKPILAGPNGLRAGWRLLIFLALLGVPAAGLLAIAHARGGHPEQVTVTPFLMGANEGLVLLILCLVTWVVGRIEHRKF